MDFLIVLFWLIGGAVAAAVDLLVAVVSRHPV